jgi:hypothetical protein
VRIAPRLVRLLVQAVGFLAPALTRTAGGPALDGDVRLDGGRAELAETSELADDEDGAVGGGGAVVAGSWVTEQYASPSR